MLENIIGLGVYAVIVVLFSLISSVLVMGKHKKIPSCCIISVSSVISSSMQKHQVWDFCSWGGGEMPTTQPSDDFNFYLEIKLVCCNQTNVDVT